MELVIQKRDNRIYHTSIIDTHFTVKCPHCGVQSGLSAVSLPDYDLARRYQPLKLGVGYQCDACHMAVFLRFTPVYDFGNSNIHLKKEYEEVERPKEDYEYNYLPKEVAEDLREALTCYSSSCFNAFAAMCRRAVQSASSALGAQGKDKVQQQIQDLKELAGLDDETFDLLKTIVLAGHDGSHPHLPALSPARAEVLLELIKDVLYQLFVRKKKIEEAAAKRKEAIAEKKK